MIRSESQKHNEITRVQKMKKLSSSSTSGPPNRTARRSRCQTRPAAQPRTCSGPRKPGPLQPLQLRARRRPRRATSAAAPARRSTHCRCGPGGRGPPGRIHAGGGEGSDARRAWADRRRWRPEGRWMRESWRIRGYGGSGDRRGGEEGEGVRWGTGTAGGSRANT